MGSIFSRFSDNSNNNHFHQIIDNLYIGDMYSIQDKFFYNKKLLVVNATPDVKFNRKLQSINVRLSLRDDLTKYSDNILFQNLDKMTDIIHTYLNKDYLVLVHCVAGRQRSCAIVAGYLMKYKKMSMIDSIDFIQHKRPFAFYFNINFIDCLKKYQQTLSC